MSEEILKVFLDDLKTIRLVCQSCQATIELEVQNLKARIETNECPLCGADFSMAGGPTGSPPAYLPLHELARVFHYLDKVKKHLRVEFPVKLNKEA